MDLCIHIKSSNDIDIIRVFDEDLATGADNRKSMERSSVFLGETLVLWSSRKQKVVSQSTNNQNTGHWLILHQKYRRLDQYL